MAKWSAFFCEKYMGTEKAYCIRLLDKIFLGRKDRQNIKTLSN